MVEQKKFKEEIRRRRIGDGHEFLSNPWSFDGRVSVPLSFEICWLKRLIRNQDRSIGDKTLEKLLRRFALFAIAKNQNTFAVEIGEMDHTSDRNSSGTVSMFSTAN